MALSAKTSLILTSISKDILQVKVEAKQQQFPWSSCQKPLSFLTMLCGDFGEALWLFSFQNKLCTCWTSPLLCQPAVVRGAWDMLGDVTRAAGLAHCRPWGREELNHVQEWQMALAVITSVS